VPIYAEMAIRPTVQEVANLMPDRTMLPSTGELAGSFTSLTQPTAVQVDAIIDMVLDALDPRVAREAGDEQERSVRAIVTLSAAVLTEATHYADQGRVSTDRIAVWERMIESHTNAILGSTEAGEGGVQHVVAGSVVNGVTTVKQLL
jgi:hypothetical protein